MLDFFYNFLAGWGVGFFITIIAIEFLKHKRRNSIIAIDFDTLVDIDAIVERGRIYVSNIKNVSLDQYFATHVSEQQPIPQGILKAIHYQRVGYKIVYFTNRPEYLRLETARILNDWCLKGELYMNTNKEEIVSYIKNNKKGKLVKVITNSL